MNPDINIILFLYPSKKHARGFNLNIRGTVYFLKRTIINTNRTRAHPINWYMPGKYFSPLSIPNFSKPVYDGRLKIVIELNALAMVKSLLLTVSKIPA